MPQSRLNADSRYVSPSERFETMTEDFWNSAEESTNLFDPNLMAGPLFESPAKPDIGDEELEAKPDLRPVIAPKSSVLRCRLSKRERT